MSNAELLIYKGLIGCKNIPSRRQIRKYLTGAERASVKAWLKAAKQAAEEEDNEESE